MWKAKAYIKPDVKNPLLPGFNRSLMSSGQYNATTTLIHNVSVAMLDPIALDIMYQNYSINLDLSDDWIINLGNVILHGL